MELIPGQVAHSFGTPQQDRNISNHKLIIACLISKC